jgi:uracil-DNA glycosylase
MILEAPGPKAIASGLVSLDNEDQTARNLKSQLAEVKMARQDVVLWNVVPWYLGDGQRIEAATRADIDSGKPYLQRLVLLLPRLECILLFGEKAREAHVFLSGITRARILGCHHPAPRGMRGENREENMKVLKMLSE